MSGGYGEITLPWGEGETTFKLAYRQLQALQKACDAGPVRIAARLLDYNPISNPHGGDWRIEDIRETIRQGLLGSETPDADRLVRKYVDEVPLNENRMVAWSILAACLVGNPEERSGKVEEPKTKASGSPMTRSPSQNSSGSPELSDATLQNSIN